MKTYILKAKAVYQEKGLKELVKKSIRYAVKSLSSLNVIEEADFLSQPLFQLTSKDLEESLKIVHGEKPEKIESANWFLPAFEHLQFGGVYTLFRFIEKMSLEGVRNRIIIYNNNFYDVEALKLKIDKSFPLLNYEVIIFDPSKQSTDELPSSDIAICSLWTSAYVLLKFNKTKAKYYFLQDYEPVFYAGGPIYALVESTYSFGFKGIVNTPGLFNVVHEKYGMEGVSFVPSVDFKIYYPNPDKDNKRLKIFFYARPKEPRNAFALGINVIKKLIDKYGDKIEVIAAGGEWNEEDYGLKGKITNLKLLKSLKEVGDLYRECDIGFFYMVSKHPSYQPFEFMASGMATVTNRNVESSWFFKEGENCLLSEPSPTAMAEKISLLIEDKALREKIVQNGFLSVQDNWKETMESLWETVNASTLAEIV